MMCDTEFECPMCLHAKVAAPEYIDSRLGAIISKIKQKRMSRATNSKIISELLFWARFSHQGEHYLLQIIIAICNMKTEITLTVEDFYNNGFDNRFFARFVPYSRLWNREDQWRFTLFNSIGIERLQYDSGSNCSKCKKIYCNFHTITFPFRSCVCMYCETKMYICDDCFDCCDSCYEIHGKYNDRIFDDFDYDACLDPPPMIPNGGVVSQSIELSVRR